ncbi:LuxR C-terminal-related transcriptional regulator [Vibrio algivorus]|uniref:Helix-turn-helix transcriptional regulator n=1 Tax=Vibrio algivorus TaxID=1667024 RepID=A0A557PD69_9VIBR|nr:LuxR C-terminal-related transcriptional regulator [Vibrio algivorus]TVO38612.1 helix-turn-helix transcriptional regulator [Vibrio algivorus]
MTCQNQETSVYLLSPLIEANDTFISIINTLVDIQLKLINYDEADKISPQQEPYVLLVDARFTEEELFELQTLPVLKKAQASALIFAPEKANLVLVSQWYNLAGYFYHSTPNEQFCDELIKMLAGHNCLPKSLLIKLFKHWQAINHQQANPTVKAKLSLTRRELEILTHLKIGQSNLDIADSLFVSEHTIKSHLYRIFRKLNVSNRRQAINWAQLYLSEG